MKAILELYEPLHDHLKVVNKRGTKKAFVYVVRFGPVVRICPSENSACKYLQKMGFRLNDEIEWVLTHKSEDQINLERLYSKV